ncbi:hypothetical protein B0H13DRAFT_1850286 [Mycena leptocephala]|nr:hypothetical protein B0H13DRAFT_1850286 [Mycena leptocephala]
MYRIMLYCNLFSDSRFSPDEIDSLDDETIQNIRRQRTAVLNGYLLHKILELNSSIHFLRGLLEKLVQDELTGVEYYDLCWVDILLSAGPASVLQAWEERDYNVLAEDLGFGASPSFSFMTVDLFVDDNKLFSGYFWHVFEKVCTTRKLPPAKEDDSGRGGRAAISSSHKPSIKVNKSLIYSYRQNEDFLSKSEFRIYATSESPPPKFSHEKLDVAIILAHFNTSSEAGGGG